MKRLDYEWVFQGQPISCLSCRKPDVRWAIREQLGRSGYAEHKRCSPSQMLHGIPACRDMYIRGIEACSSSICREPDRTALFTLTTVAGMRNFEILMFYKTAPS